MSLSDHDTRISIEFAVLSLLAVLMGIVHAYSAQAAPPSKVVYDDELLYCTELKDADAMAKEMAMAGEGSHTVTRPPSCAYRRITYELLRVRSVHTRDHILYIGVVEAADAAVPEKKYYLIIPTQAPPDPDSVRS